MQSCPTKSCSAVHKPWELTDHHITTENSKTLFSPLAVSSSFSSVIVAVLLLGSCGMITLMEVPFLVLFHPPLHCGCKSEWPTPSPDCRLKPHVRQSLTFSAVCYWQLTCYIPQLLALLPHSHPPVSFPRCWINCVARVCLCWQCKYLRVWVIVAWTTYVRKSMKFFMNKLLGFSLTEPVNHSLSKIVLHISKNSRQETVTAIAIKKVP